MQKIIIFALAGFLAELVDGSLGMGYGASASSILLTFGIPPAIASATVHFSEILTTAAAGTSHLKFNNVHKPSVLKLAIPGSIAAFVGAMFLSNVNGDYMKPIISIFLLLLGIYIIYQFLFKSDNKINNNAGFKKVSNFVLLPQAAIAGFLDSIGGGGWGPVNTPLLLSSKKIEPRYVIGTVSASEFFVTISSSLSFLIFLNWASINWILVLVLGISGVVAAPISAWLVKSLPINILAIGVGGLIVYTNISSLTSIITSNESAIITVKIIVVLTWLALVLTTALRNKTKVSTTN